MKIALVNYSTRITDNAQLEAMMAAAVKLTNEQFAPAWNLECITGEFYADPSQCPPDAYLIVVQDTDTSVPDALGYHVNPDLPGPTGYVLAAPVLDAGGGVLDGGTIGSSVASVLGHELFELLIDLYTNSWVMMPDGRFLAMEVSDPCEGSSISVVLNDGTVVLMSDAVTPAYFDETAPLDGSTKFTLANALTAPFQCGQGGYQIIYDPSKLADPNGPISNVFGDTFPKWKAEMKAKLTSRMSRRSLRALVESSHKHHKH